jgi:hypothetical protein
MSTTDEVEIIKRMGLMINGVNCASFIKKHKNKNNY